MIYNYRHSRARRVSENAFGILSARWRIFRRPIEANPDNVVKITKACIALHNYLTQTDFSNSPKVRYVQPTLLDQELSNGDIVNGTWRDMENQSMRSVNRTSSNMHTSLASTNRDRLKDFFLSDAGKVPWQEKVVRRGRIG